MKYKVILFDVGGTLIHPYPSVGAVYSQAGKKFGIEMSEDTASQSFFSAWKTVRKSWKSPLCYGTGVDDARKFWMEIVFNTFSSYNGSHDMNGLFDYLFNLFSYPEVWSVDEEVYDVLSKLKKENYILGILSNWDFRLPELLKSLKLSVLFDYQFISYAVGLEKPDIRIFHHVLEQLKKDPQDVLYIGNDYEDDYLPSQKMNMDCYLLKSLQSKEIRDDVSYIHSIKDLFSIL